MRVLQVRPDHSGRTNLIARFDVEIDGMRLFNLALKRTNAGYRVFAPSVFGSAAATFTPATASALIAAALGEIRQHDEHSHAA